MLMKHAVAIAAVLAAACGAPRAAPISGDVQTAIARALAEGTERFDHGVWNLLLARYALDGGRRFDYAGLKKEEERFESYIASLAAVDLATLSASELEALFINAYNAYTVRTILSRVSPDGAYGIESIRDVENAFTREDHVVGGFRLSLDNIEHNVLRPTFRDPRLHFAVNCASNSCPPLPTTAFTGAGIDSELEAAAAGTLQNPDYVSVDGDALVLTKILDWYGSDFTDPGYRGAEDSVARFVRKYATDDVRAWIDGRGEEVPLRFRDYDWRLNRPES
jgi:hypothetical protein